MPVFYSTNEELLFNYSEASWKRPDTGERVSGYERDDVFRPVESAQVESEPNFPKPAEGKKGSNPNHMQFGYIN